MYTPEQMRDEADIIKSRLDKIYATKSQTLIAAIDDDIIKREAMLRQGAEAVERGEALANAVKSLTGRNVTASNMRIGLQMALDAYNETAPPESKDD